MTPEPTRPCSVCGSSPFACPHFTPTCAAVWDAEGVVPVVAAVVRRGGRVLLCRRPREKRHGGLWEFPGGKLLKGETLGEAVLRELAEELHLVLTGLGRHLGRRHDPGAPFEIHFVEAEAEGDPVSTEHEEIVWAAPEEVLAYDLAPGDRAFAEGWARTG